jgi:hypothetical protein
MPGVASMRTIACIGVMLLLAGCSDPPAAAPSGSETTPMPTGSGGPMGISNASALAPVPMSLPVLLEGNLGSYAHGCVFAAGPPQCTTQVAVEDEADVIIEHPGSNFTGLDLNLTWESTSPATDELALSFMVMSDNHVDSTVYDVVSGTSPLRATLTGENVPLNDTSVVHIYVYNPSGFQMMPGGVGYTVTSVDLDFRLEGTVRIATMP